MKSFLLCYICKSGLKSQICFIEWAALEVFQLKSCRQQLFFLIAFHHLAEGGCISLFFIFLIIGGIGFLCQNPTAFYPVGTWHFKTLVKLWRGLKRPCRQTSCFNSNLPIRLYVNLCILGMLFTCKSLDCVDIQESLRLLLNFTILKVMSADSELSLWWHSIVLNFAPPPTWHISFIYVVGSQDNLLI